MSPFRPFIAFLVSVGLATSAAAGATLDGVTLPDTISVDGRTLVLNGIGVRTLTIFSVKIYVAGLYLLDRSHDAQAILKSDEPRAVTLEFLHAGSKADVEKEYREGERVNCGGGECAASDAADFERLVAAAPGVAVGDTSTYIFANGGVEVLANGREIGRFANRDLAYRLLSGFIGEHPPTQALRAALLGEAPAD